MKYNTIKSLFTAICDAIRESDGTYSKIKHQDIPERIGKLRVSGEATTVMPKVMIVDAGCNSICVNTFDESEVEENTTWSVD